MSDVIIPYRFLVRGGTAAAVATLNEIPKARELIYETDTLKYKLGDGVTHYNDLEYAGVVDAAGVPYDNSYSGLTATDVQDAIDELASASVDIAGDIHAATGKTTPVDADEMALVDSAASFVLKKLTWANLKATLKTYFDTLYMASSFAFTRYVAPPFANVSSLMHFNGTNGSTTITDQIAGNSWTAQGGAALDTSQSAFGVSSVKILPSSNSCLWMPTNSKFDVGAGDWALEFRIKPLGTHQTSARIFQTRDGDIYAGIYMVLDNSNILNVGLSSTGTGFNLLNTTAGQCRAGVFNTVIFQRVGDVIECWVNGYVYLSTGISAGASLYYNAADTIIIGGNKTGVSRSINAAIDEFRFTKGRSVIAPAVPPLTSEFPDS